MKEPTMYDIHAFQLLHYFVTKHGYQIVTIKQQRNDMWLMNPGNEAYPIIRLSTTSNAETLENMDYLRQVHKAILALAHKDGRLFIINTNPESTVMDNDFLAQVPVTMEGCSDEPLKTEFPGITEVLHDVEDPKKEYVRLTRSLEKKQMEIMRKQRKAITSWKNIPRFTGIVMLVCIAVFALASMLSMYLEDTTVAAILSGAYYKMNIVSMHEYWRLLTAGFLHIDIFHLLMNLIALMNVGTACEKAFTKKQYGIILFSSIVIGNLFVFLSEGNLIGLGISGGIFGLLGAFIATLFENGSIKHPMVKATVMRLLMLNLLISFMPGISMMAHLGGFVWGCFLGILFSKSEQWALLRKNVFLSMAILLGVTCGMAVRVNVVQPLDRNLDARIIKSVNALGLEWYGSALTSNYLDFYTKEELGI